jgi:hypothetical protein
MKALKVSTILLSEDHKFCILNKATVYRINKGRSYIRLSSLDLVVRRCGNIEAASVRAAMLGRRDLVEKTPAEDYPIWVSELCGKSTVKPRRCSKKSPTYDVVVRWLGAFGPQRFQQSLTDAVRFELEGHQRQVAAEPILGRSAIEHARVGLLVDRRHVLKVHDGDVWSIRKGKSLVPTQEPQGSHMEAFCNQVYRALVVKGEITSSARLALEAISKESGLPILDLYTGDNINPELKALQ